MEYGSKPVILFGSITSFGLTQTKEPVVFLNDYGIAYKESYGLMSVACVFNKSDRELVASLRERARITVRGIVEGPAGTFLHVKKCKIIKN